MALTLPRFPARRNSCVGNEAPGHWLPCPAWAWRLPDPHPPSALPAAAGLFARPQAQRFYMAAPSYWEKAIMPPLFIFSDQGPATVLRGRCADQRSASTIVTPAAVPPAAGTAPAALPDRPRARSRPPGGCWH
ncbi:hypothetical protein AL480_02835 [Stenotrophomonas maltophilia]|nr:hypothetical protein AL480_02835 [Stenotrophomonas maltophilia]